MDFFVMNFNFEAQNQLYLTGLCIHASVLTVPLQIRSKLSQLPSTFYNGQNIFEFKNSQIFTTVKKYFEFKNPQFRNLRIKCPWNDFL